MPGRIVIRLGGVVVEAPLEPEALRALRSVFEALGLRLEEEGGTVTISKIGGSGVLGEEA